MAAFAGRRDRGRCERLLNWLFATGGLLLSLWLSTLDCGAGGQPHDYQIVVVVDPARIDATAQGRQAWLRELRLDDQPAAPDAVRAEGSWRAEPAGSIWQYVCENPTAPTSLAFRCASFSVVALAHPWSGRIDVLRDGALLGSVALTAATGTELHLHFGAVTDLGFLLLGCGIGGCLLLLLRPDRGGWRLLAWLAALLSLVHLTAWLFTPIGATTDSGGYLTSIDHLRAGLPSVFPPGYGLFLHLVGAFGGHVGLIAAAVQHALVVLLGVLLCRRFRDLAGEPWAFLGALVEGVAYPTVFGAQAAMSETWTCVLLMATVMLALHGDRRRGLPAAAGAGLAAAWAGLTRVVPLAVSLPLFVARGLLPWRQRSWRWLLASAGVALLGVAAVVAHNGLRSGQWKLSTIPGRHLYNHFVFQQKLLDPNGPGTQRMQALLGGRDPRTLVHWLAGEAIPAGTEAEWNAREQLFETVAWEAARTASLFDHLAFTCGLTWRNLSGDAVPTMAFGAWGENLEPRLIHPALVGGHARLLQARAARLNAVVWPLLSWLLVLALPAVLLLRHGRGEWLAWLWTVWAYMFASSAVEYELQRYHVAVAPIVGMLAIAQFGLACQWLGRPRTATPAAIPTPTPTPTPS